jgi:AcrR family transcriptional regulator
VDIAERIAGETLASREEQYAGEVRRILDAALGLMRRNGVESRPRVADIVAAAGVSNDAFYRHFKSKDALVSAILDDGSQRLCSYLAHQMAKESSPDRQVKRWVEGVLSQADGAVADDTRAVLWNGSGSGDRVAAGRHYASEPLAELLHEPFVALGSAAPELDAALAAHAVLGRLADHLWQQTEPSAAERKQITAFCLRAARS